MALKRKAIRRIATATTTHRTQADAIRAVISSIEDELKKSIEDELKKRMAERVSAPKVISRKYLSPAGKSEIGVHRIKKAVKATKESKARAARAR